MMTLRSMLGLPPERRRARAHQIPHRERINRERARRAWRRKDWREAPHTHRAFMQQVAEAMGDVVSSMRENAEFGDMRGGLRWRVW